jgi:signal transduction histidine kinase
MSSILNRIKQNPVFDHVPENQLEWLIDKAQLRQLKMGEKMFKVNDPIDHLFIVLKGQVEVKIKRGNNYRVVGQVGAHGISGFLPYSRAKNAVAEGLVVEDMEVLALSKTSCKEMALNHYELTEVFVHEMTSRTREFAKSNVQAEKMMALGKLSAGLAHELNNPASAILRSAKELKKHLGNVPEKFKAVMSMKVNEHQVSVVNDIIFKKLGQEYSFSLAERSDREDELEEWLEDRDLEDYIEIVDTLVDYNFFVGDLQEIYESAGEQNFGPTLDWVGNVLTTEKMVGEIEEASTRISDLVQSVKVYTHMDNAPEKQKADIRKGIVSTITMLNHKIKKKKINIHTNFDKDLQEARIMVSEINQVWTNLLDNAIDALEDRGEITINGYSSKNCVTVEIIDNGSGIPEEHLNRIFDPFFTTKAIGEGTGMGLEVVYRIVNQHNGDIHVTSTPGETKFKIDLPID